MEYCGSESLGEPLLRLRRCDDVVNEGLELRDEAVRGKSGVPLCRSNGQSFQGHTMGLDDPSRFRLNTDVWVYM